MTGYLNYSRSLRSQKAIDDYEVPISLINKTLIEDFMFENEFSDSDEKYLSTLSISFWKFAAEKNGASSWHHTSKFFNETNHYNILNVANFILENKEYLKSSYGKYLKSKRPTEEDKKILEEKRQQKIELAEKTKLFKYQTKYKSLNGFLKSDSNFEEIRKIRLEKIANKREELKMRWEKQNYEYGLKSLGKDELVESYIK